MNVRQILCGSLLLCVNAVASACDLPALVILPAAGTAGDASAELIVDMQRYVGGIRAYTACVQAEIAAAGGDSAPESLRTLLIRRNNGAVAEAKALMELFGERVAPVEELYLAEFVATGALECISNARLESTAVVDDLAVLFIERAGRTYLNVLGRNLRPTSCVMAYFQVSRDVVAATTPQMGAVQTNRLCTRDFIVPYRFETRAVRQPPLSARLVLRGVAGAGRSAHAIAPRASSRTALNQQKRQRLRAALRNFQREQLVGAGAAEIDGRDRLAGVGRRAREAVARVHHQRRADDEHRVGLLERRKRALRLVPRARARRRTRRRASAARRTLRSPARRTPRSRCRRARRRRRVPRAPRAPRRRGCAASARPAPRSRGTRRSQPRQRTTSTRPCRSMTLRLPAA